MIVEKDHIKNYIPHREPILMVSRLVHISEDNKTALTELDIQPDNILLQNNELREGGILEHIAQSIALKNGYRFKKENKEIPLGYIGKVNDVEIHFLPEIHSTIQTEITEEMSFGAATVVRAVVKQKNVLLAKAKMNVYMQL